MMTRSSESTSPSKWHGVADDAREIQIDPEADHQRRMREIEASLPVYEKKKISEEEKAFIARTVK